MVPNLLVKLSFCNVSGSEVHFNEKFVTKVRKKHYNLFPQNLPNNFYSSLMYGQTDKHATKRQNLILKILHCLNLFNIIKYPLNIANECCPLNTSQWEKY